jgi:hypothetical protein
MSKRFQVGQVKAWLDQGPVNRYRHKGRQNRDRAGLGDQAASDW